MRRLGSCERLRRGSKTRTPHHSLPLWGREKNKPPRLTPSPSGGGPGGGHRAAPPLPHACPSPQPSPQRGEGAKQASPIDSLPLWGRAGVGASRGTTISSSAPLISNQKTRPGIQAQLTFSPAISQPTVCACSPCPLSPQAARRARLVATAAIPHAAKNAAGSRARVLA